LGSYPSKAKLLTPTIEEFQESAIFGLEDPFPVEPAFVTQSQIHHSYRSESTGLARAALMDW
jgi:hypothetical protein